MSSNVGFQNQDFVQIILADFDRKFSPAKIRGILNDALNYGYQYMQTATPVRTGFLKSSEGFTVKSDFEGELFATAPYAGHVNDGTIYQNPQPFFDTGVEATAERLRETFHGLL